MSLREKIFAADDIATETVEVPEWGVTVEVRGMNGSDRSRILELAAGADDGRMSIGSMYVETVIASTYDPETGERVFSDSDRDMLMTKSATAIDRLAQVGMRLSAMTGEAQDNAKKQFPEEPAS
jgi:hypothetical protein